MVELDFYAISTAEAFAIADREGSVRLSYGKRLHTAKDMAENDLLLCKLSKKIPDDFSAAKYWIVSRRGKEKRPIKYLDDPEITDFFEKTKGL